MTAFLIRRLEQVRAHLDVEHRHLVDEVYAALAPADPTLGTGDIPPLSEQSLQEASGQGASHLNYLAFSRDPVPITITWHPMNWIVCDNEDGT